MRGKNVRPKPPTTKQKRSTSLIQSSILRLSTSGRVVFIESLKRLKRGL